MLLIPFDRPIDWRRPPLVTFTLVALNVIAFLAFQLDDRQELRNAHTYYYESGLAGIELPRYRDYLERQGETEFVEVYGEHIDNPDAPWFGRLLGDAEFQRRLDDEQVVPPDDPVHAEWQRKHAGFEQRLDATTSWGWGLIPAQSDPGTFLTHMFLHGGWFHLIGNMIFLIAVGLLVEVGLGALTLLGLYLVGGLGSAGLFIALQPGSVVPLVGASGAISGLMGLCGILYGLRRVRFFYFIGVYFDYVKAPALVLLGLWLGKEVVQYLRFSEISNVAYTAHIGGILTGALAGGIVRFGTNAVDEEALDEREQKEEYDRRLGEATERLNALEPERARPLFERMLRDYPGDRAVLDGLFRASRYAPASEGYHDVVQRILALEGDDEVTTELVLRAFRDYRDRAKPKPRVGVAAMRRMIELLLRRGSAAEAAPLVQAGLKHPDRFPGIEDAALRLARRYEREGDAERARRLYRHLHERFAATAAGRQAERALSGVGS